MTSSDVKDMTPLSDYATHYVLGITNFCKI